ncbi:MAG: hypothetical protein MRK01_05750 [Candidatus Scalindua sp.]|nr:hypothetical protein [Candidatus Scalindua sp.]
MLKLLKDYIILLAASACISGCYTSDMRHNAAHNRMFKKDMQLLHQDIDYFFGTEQPSTLSDEKSLEVITDS